MPRPRRTHEEVVEELSQKEEEKKKISEQQAAVAQRVLEIEAKSAEGYGESITTHPPAPSGIVLRIPRQPQSVPAHAEVDRDEHGHDIGQPDD